MGKRISSRAVIIDGDYLYVMFRRRINNGVVSEYYVIPGGGIDENETLEENVIREIKEEFSVDVEIEGYLGYDEGEATIAHFFKCNILSGIPTLGGEELDKCSEENYYEIRKIPLSDIEKIDISPISLIKKAVNGEYEDLKESKFIKKA